MSNLPPKFDDLPAVKDMPKGCAWGVFDQSGQKDVLGTLNLLTPTVIQAAYRELNAGISVSLNWPIGAIATPGFGRKGLVHHVKSFKGSPIDAHGYDDEVEFNTQCSSQWDSLCHFHHQPSGKGYNGVATSVEELTSGGKGETLPTLNHWHARGGLVARGVFLDYKRYADATGIQYSPFESHAITPAALEACAKHQGVEFKTGDVLVIRSGFTDALGGVSGDEQAKLMASHRCVGVSGDRETAKWFWDHRFAAAAGDMIAFEHLPPRKGTDGSGLDGGGEEGSVVDLVLHQWFLALFGMPIGELWDLKALSETCEKLNRWSFVLTSAPLNVPGSIGSPPNALALF